MSVAFTVRPAATVDALTFTHITATGLDTGTVYYMAATATGQPTLTSVRFAGPAFTWDNLTFPAAASVTVTLRKDSDDSSVATQAITVQ